MGDFCCPVSPVPLVSASVARCGPNRAFTKVTQSVGTSLRGNCERLVVVGTCGFEPSRWSHAGRKLRFSAHVDPSSAPSGSAARAGFGGAAGYRPRVRCAYDTPQFIAIAGRGSHQSSTLMGAL